MAKKKKKKKEKSALAKSVSMKGVNNPLVFPNKVVGFDLD